MDGLQIGRIVHLIDPETRDHTAAVVTVVHHKKEGLVNLYVFPSGRPQSYYGVVTSVRYNAAGNPGTWHWVERA